MSAYTLMALRNAGFLLFGALCIVYAIGAVIVSGQPFSGWWLLAAGALLNVVLFSGYALSGRRNILIVWDELASATWKRALELGYIITVSAIPLLALGLEYERLTTGVAFAVIVGVIAGAPMLIFALLNYSGGR